MSPAASKEPADMAEGEDIWHVPSDLSGWVLLLQEILFVVRTEEFFGVGDLDWDDWWGLILV